MNLSKNRFSRNTAIASFFHKTNGSWFAARLVSAMMALLWMNKWLVGKFGQLTIHYYAREGHPLDYVQSIDWLCATSSANGGCVPPERPTILPLGMSYTRITPLLISHHALLGSSYPTLSEICQVLRTKAPAPGCPPHRPAAGFCCLFPRRASLLLPCGRLFYLLPPHLLPRVLLHITELHALPLSQEPRPYPCPWRC